MYVSVSLLLFSELKRFSTIFDVWMIYFDSAMGSWDLTVYDSKVYGHKGNNVQISIFGRMWHLLYILINVVILLNFIIAILGNTYAVYEEIRKGLFYDVLINVFPLYQWHEVYGFITCA